MDEGKIGDLNAQKNTWFCPQKCLSHHRVQIVCRHTVGLACVGALDQCCDVYLSFLLDVTTVSYARDLFMVGHFEILKCHLSWKRYN